jgi:NADH:ubiquinone oxidoreductase subunit D
MIVSYNCPGGLMYDIHRFSEQSKGIHKIFQATLPEYDQLLTGNVISG